LKIVDYCRRSCRWTLAGLPVAVPLAQRWQRLHFGNLKRGASGRPASRLSQIALAQICFGWPQPITSQPHTRLGWSERHHVLLHSNL
jgi:hypothetical protein